MLVVRHYAQDGIKLRVETSRPDNGAARILIKAKVIDPSMSPDEDLSGCLDGCDWDTLFIPNGGYKDGDSKA